jgi:hypothetical protein
MGVPPVSGAGGSPRSLTPQGLVKSHSLSRLQQTAGSQTGAGAPSSMTGPLSAGLQRMADRTPPPPPSAAATGAAGGWGERGAGAGWGNPTQPPRPASPAGLTAAAAAAEADAAAAAGAAGAANNSGSSRGGGGPSTRAGINIPGPSAALQMLAQQLVRKPGAPLRSSSSSSAGLARSAGAARATSLKTLGAKHAPATPTAATVDAVHRRASVELGSVKDSVQSRQLMELMRAAERQAPVVLSPAQGGRHQPKVPPGQPPG